MSKVPVPEADQALTSLLQASTARITGAVRPLSSVVVGGKVLIICQHCGREAEEKRRGLCRPCYDVPAIRDLYPSEHRGGVDTSRGFTLPKLTLCRPGSEKVSVLIERRRNKQALWNKQSDAKSEEEEAFAAMLDDIEEDDELELQADAPLPAWWRLPRYGPSGYLALGEGQVAHA